MPLFKTVLCPTKKLVVQMNNLASPAIIVIGEVVRESNKLKGFYEEFISNEINK